VLGIWINEWGQLIVMLSSLFFLTLPATLLPCNSPAVSLLLRVEAREGQELEAAVGAVEQVLRDRVTPSVIRTMWDVGSAHVTWSLPG
jgi:hypothetical protein